MLYTWKRGPGAFGRQADTYLAIQLSLNKAYNFKRKASCYIDDMVTSDFRFVFFFFGLIYTGLSYSPIIHFLILSHTPSPYHLPYSAAPAQASSSSSHTRDKPVHPYPIRSHYRFSPDLKGGRGSHKSALSLSSHQQ